METGRKILNLRKDCQIPQKTLAVQVSLTPSALSRIESSHHQPRGPVAFKVARILGVTVDYLLDESQPYPAPGRELLKNLERADKDEPRDQSIEIAARERKVLEALRQFNEEEIVMLEALIDASREQRRFGVYVLGAADKLPGIEAEELARFEERLRPR